MYFSNNQKKFQVKLKINATHGLSKITMDKNKEIKDIT
jgi:hypothetical protein